MFKMVLENKFQQTNKNKINHSNDNHINFEVSLHFGGDLAYCVSSLAVTGVPWHRQILADQLTLSQLGGRLFPQNNTVTPVFSDLPTALHSFI